MQTPKVLSCARNWNFVESFWKFHFHPYLAIWWCGGERKSAEIIFVLFSFFLSQVQIREKWLAAKGVIKGLNIFCPAELLKFSFKVRNFWWLVVILLALFLTKRFIILPAELLCSCSNWYFDENQPSIKWRSRNLEPELNFDLKSITVFKTKIIAFPAKLKAERTQPWNLPNTLIRGV